MLRPPVMHAVRGSDGALLATYTEERPFVHVAAPRDGGDVWQNAIDADDAWRAECGPRLVKVAVPTLPQQGSAAGGSAAGYGVGSAAPPPVLVDVYVPPLATVTKLGDSLSFSTKEEGQCRSNNKGLEYADVPEPPDFLIYAGADPVSASTTPTRAAAGIAAAVSEPSLWDSADFQRIYAGLTAEMLPKAALRKKTSPAAAGAAASPTLASQVSTGSSTGGGVTSFRVRRRGTSASPDRAGSPSLTLESETGTSNKPTTLESDETPLGESLTAHGRLVDGYFHRAVTAFCHWASLVIRRFQAVAASQIHNDRFSFEYAACLKPRVESGTCALAVDTRADNTATVFVRLNLFADLRSDAGITFRRSLLDVVESWGIARLPDLIADPAELEDDSANDDTVSSGTSSSPASPSATRSKAAGGVTCAVRFAFTNLRLNDPSSVPTMTTLSPSFSATAEAASADGELRKRRAAVFDDEGTNASLRQKEEAACPTAVELVELFQSRLDNAIVMGLPNVAPTAAPGDTLHDLIPMIERHVVDVVVTPVARWLRLVGAFRAVFGPTLHDGALCSLVDTSTVQFMVLDSHGVHQVGVVVTLSWRVPVPMVTYSSAQHFGANGQPIVFSWAPSSPAPSVDDPCGVAASAFAYLHDNFHKLVRVCEVRGMHARS